MNQLLPFGCVHSSTVIKHKGQVYVTFFAGPREGSPDTHIWLQNVTEGVLRQITNQPGPHWNPVLFEWWNELYLAYKQGPHPWDWKTHIVMVMGHEPYFEHTIDGGPVKNKPLIMSNGQLIAGHSTEDDGWKCYASLLEPADWHNDGGYHLDARETWTNIPIDSSVIRGRGVIQPTLWESEPGHVHMMMRSAMGHVCRADSEDYGRTWGMARPIDLYNNNSGIDVVKVGQTLYLVMNPIMAEGMSARTRFPLDIATSNDNGETWNTWRTLESDPGEFSYPAIVYDPKDNELLVTYTYNKHSIKLQTIPLGA